MNSTNATHLEDEGVFDDTKKPDQHTNSIAERNYLKSLATEANINALGLIKSLKQEVVDQILETTDRIANILQLPSVMNYEAIILMNPLDTNPVLMSNTDHDREQELFFYQIHRDIEHLLFPIIQRLFQLIEKRSNGQDENNITETLMLVQQELSEVIQKMSLLYRNLDKDSFARFRKFFTRIQFRDVHGELYPGPSGASSAAFPTLDILFGIEQTGALSPLADEVRPKMLGRGYTTISEMNKAKCLVALHGNLFERCCGSDGVDAMLKKCVDTIKQFRINHRAQVEKFVPEALQGELTGTGGATDVAQYLDSMIENTKRKAT